MTEPLRELAVLPRPRSHWQAMDAGMLLARAHYARLLGLWALFSLPFAAIAFALVLAGVSQTFVVFFYWWFKPLYELPLLMYLSRALFLEPTSIRQAMRESRSHWLRLICSYLTLSRLSPSRSMSAPVVFLEQQSGKARRQRVSVLTRETTRAYTFMVAWLHVEAVGFYALILLVMTLMPYDYTFDQIFANLLGEDQARLSVLETFAYIIGPWLMAGLVAPMYVGGGFLLYINRRMRLEAWDIEHQFHDLQRKHHRVHVPEKLASHWLPLSFSALIGISLATLSPAQLAHADTTREPPSVEMTRQATETIYDSPDFGSTETRSRLRFKRNNNATKRDIPKSDKPILKILANALLVVFSLAKYLIYLVAGAFIALIVWRLLSYIPDSWQFRRISRRRRPTQNLLDVKHHPLTKSLPSDIAKSAREMLALGDNRKALSHLYRGALRTVMRRYALSVPGSATERECKYRVAQCNHTEQSNSFNQIVDHWTKVAYANLQPDTDTISALIDFWETHFGDDAPVTKTRGHADPGSGHQSGAVA